MRSLWRGLVASVFVATACGQTTPLGGTGGGAGGGIVTGGAGGAIIGGSGGARADGGPGVTAQPAGLQYSGAVITRPQIEISAPILPRTGVIYQPFPATLAGEQTMAHDAALTFDWLLGQCAPLYPGITLTSGGATLTTEQLGTNYELVARCSYEQYTAKPYWIPKLIDDVDICADALGGDWRLVTEGDLTSLTPADLQLLRDVMAPIATAAPTDVFSTFYFGFHIWIRAEDGSIAAATLDPTGAVVERIDFTSGLGPTNHYEGGLALRCLHRDTLP
jgi:hypothetical protein